MFGDADPHVPAAGREQIAKALAPLGPRLRIETYAAEHAFMRDEGARYDAEACDAVWRDAVAFFQRVFRRELTA